MKKKLKGGALLYVIAVSVIISALTGTLLLYSEYSQIELVNYAQIERAHRNALSGINFLLADDEIKLGEEKQMDLFGEKMDSVSLKRKPWGAFELISSEAKWKNISAKQVALSGYYLDTAIALYLCDRDRPLSLCGKTIITGKCYLPKAGVKRAYIEGQNFIGDKMIEGEVKESSKTLPLINEDLLKQINSFFTTSPDSYDLMSPDEILDSLENSFDKKTICIYSSAPIEIAAKKILGNVVIISDKKILVRRDAKLNDAILYAPKIEFEQNFSGCLQAFATDTMKIGKECNFSYPTVLGITRNKLIAVSPLLIVDEKSKIDGIVFAHQETYDNRYQVKITLDKETKLRGLVYSNGLVDLKGELFGSLYTYALILSTPSSVYENHLLNATIDATKLSKHFTSVNLVQQSDKKKNCKMGLLKLKLKGSTLVESLVAMVILVICTGIASMIYVNVLESQRGPLKLKANALLEQVANDAKESKNFLDEEIRSGNITIVKTTKKYADKKGLLQLEAKAIDANGKLITERKELVLDQ